MRTTHDSDPTLPVPIPDCPRLRRGIALASLRDNDLVGQERVTVGQIEHRLMSQLLRVVGARASLQDDLFIRVNNVKVTNPTVGDTVDVAFDELGKLLMFLPGPNRRSSALELYIGMPVSHLIGFTARATLGA